MAFDYESNTRDHYKSESVAQTYHSGFAGRLRRESIAHRVVAHFERRAIAGLLERVPHDSVLDLPCGTGKLAAVLRGRVRRVVAADVSPQMLGIAKTLYAGSGIGEQRFLEADVTALDPAVIGRHDVAVCLRLLHRIPADVKDRALQQLLGCADHLIVSTGIETGFHRLRRHVRGLLLGGDTSALCFEPFAEAHAHMARAGEVLAWRWIAPGISQEAVFLLRARRPA